MTPIDVAPSFELSTPPRPSLSTSKIEFETSLPPKGLPELPGPLSSSEDEVESINIASSNRQSDIPLSLNVTKTPWVPGAWAATSVPARLQTPQPTSSSFVLTKLSPQLLGCSRLQVAMVKKQMIQMRICLQKLLTIQLWHHLLYKIQASF
jgi:hypothetical protein